MGITKITPRGLGRNFHSEQSSSVQPHNEFVLEEKLPVEKVPGYGSDDSGVAEVGCEYAIVGGQRCSIPYELYDLPDLKKILSLETWNCHLTEDERFSLVALLPDIDQETFWLTMQELLTGAHMFFGSPLKKFYNQLKGGIYSPQVTSLREDLQIFRKSEYYHNLRSYHENLCLTFFEMKRIWDKCQQSNGVQERVQIWNCRKKQKPIFLVDLNAFPGEGILKKEERNEETQPLSKKIKCKNGSNDLEVVSNGQVCNDTRKSKGLLKLKPTVTNLAQKQFVQPLPVKAGEPSKLLPKGVLKIKSKDGNPNQERPRTKPEQILLDIWGGDAPIISTSHFSFKKSDLKFSEMLPILHHIDRDGSTYRNQEILQDWQREELLHAGAKSFMDYERFQRKPKLTTDARPDSSWIREMFPFRTSQSLRLFSQEAVQIGEGNNERQILNNTSTQPNRSIYDKCPDSRIQSFPLALENCHKTRLNAIIPESGSRISNNCTDKNQILTRPLDHLEHEIKHEPSNVAMPEVEKSLMFPITYKRKKPYTKLNNVDSQTTVLANPDTAATSGTVKPRHMAIKIKFRGCTGYNG
ncbi:hypothetical protein Cni_G28257 [Canna indica]|uniref:DEUBAD domain-containing protein n=1 Tax=Canna indica TaxID=4628 RepID=A0AAQ3L2N9_9LILI|nr:hypothetical protein Cni_G28257 [Canna indica]